MTSKQSLFLEVLMKSYLIWHYVFTPHGHYFTPQGQIVLQHEVYSILHLSPVKTRRQTNCQLKRHPRQKMTIQFQRHLELPSLQKNTKQKTVSSQTGEGTHEESGGGCSGCGFRGEQCSASCYHSGQNQSLNWRASPTPRINWGVLMDSEWIN